MQGCYAFPSQNKPQVHYLIISDQGEQGPVLSPFTLGNSWLHSSQFKRLKNTSFGIRKVSSLLSNMLPFDFHSRLLCVGMLERKPQR